MVTRFPTYASDRMEGQLIAAQTNATCTRGSLKRLRISSCSMWFKLMVCPAEDMLFDVEELFPIALVVHNGFLNLVGDNAVDDIRVVCVAKQCEFIGRRCQLFGLCLGKLPNIGAEQVVSRQAVVIDKSIFDVRLQ